MTIRYLQVEFREKDLVKSLGARWDNNSKQWFIPSHLDAAAFARWLPAGDVPASMVASEEPGDGISLSQLLLRVSQAVNQLTPKAEWVKAEISECRATKNGHVHLDLIELDAHKNLLGKANAKLFKQQADVVLDKFMQATQSPLAAGMKVLLSVRVQFHIQFGFALIIEDIDPTYTLGDVAAKLRHIRETLQQEGIFDCNKQLVAPREFYRLAVLSPQGAAGLGDFKQEADLLAKYGLCHFQYYHSTFQGDTASAGLTQALALIIKDHGVHAFDAVVIIRGGGAVIDLAWLNDLELARQICLAPLPVFSGIGHERDNTIVDEVANRRFDTPSKVIGHVLSTTLHNAKQAQNDLATIDKQVRHTLKQANQNLMYGYQQIQNSIRQGFDLASKDVYNSYQQVIVSAQHRLDTLRITVQHCHHQVGVSCLHQLQQSQSIVENTLQHLRQDAHRAVEGAQQNIKIWQEEVWEATRLHSQEFGQQVVDYHQQIYEKIQQACYYYQDELKKNLLHVVSLGPEATLQRGFALVTGVDGQLIHSVTHAKHCRQFEVRFQDGSLTVQPIGMT